MRLSRIVCLLALAGWAAPLRGADDDTVAAAVKRDHAVMQRQSSDKGIPIAVTIAPRTGLKFPPLADRRVASRLRWFLALNVAPESKLAKLLTAKEPAVVIALVGGDGEVQATLASSDRVEGALLTIKEVAAKVRSQCLEKLAKEGATEAEYKTAVESLIRMDAPARELAPLLKHKSAAVRAAVLKALAALPPDPVTIAAWDGLKSTDAGMRLACYRLASAGSRVPKTPGLKFWQDASEDERDAALRKWRDAGMPDLGPLNPDILEFVESQLGKPVGDGESPTLAAEALLAAQAESQKMVGPDMVWGREVKKGGKVLPGDILYQVNCKFRLGNRIEEAVRHVQIVRKVVGPGKYEVYEQNANGRKTVGTGVFDLGTLIQGSVKVYRPVGK